jgi:pimeloyl-ACP methyl ester carboxylesterase
MVTIHAAASYGDQLAGAVIVDTPVRRPSPESEEGRSGRAFRHPGTYATEAEATEHFRLIPPQPSNNPYIIDHIARRSIHKVDAGWTWKFDPNLFRGNIVARERQLASVQCRVALFTGEKSAIVPPDVADYMYELMGRVSPVIEIPEAHHHLMLDQPLAFVAALRTLLGDWNHSTPHVRSETTVVD